jgi:MFS family permease
MTLNDDIAGAATRVDPIGPPGHRPVSPLLVPTLVAVTALVSIVSSLGAPLIPTIAQADHVSLGTAQWVLTAALLTGALATPTLGRLADGSHQRELILIVLVGVLTGCVLAALSNSFDVVVAGRALQGFGLGLFPVTMAIARRHLPLAKAGPAIATLSITVAIGGGLGYPITALIVQTFGVHAAYWFGAIIVGLAIPVAAIVLSRRTPMPIRPFDRLGATMLSLVVLGIMVVLSEGGVWGWMSPLSLGIGAGCLVLLAAWIPHELRRRDPLVDLRQVRNRSVLTADISGFLLCVSMYLFVPVAFEFVQIPRSTGYGFGASIIISGLVFVPLSAGTFAASRSLAFLEGRFGPRGIIPLGALIIALSEAVFAVEHSSLWQTFVAAGGVGIGVGLTFAAMPGFIVRAVPRAETGSAMGFYQVLRNIGLATGSALGASVLIGATLKGHTFPAESGFRTALFIAAGMCVATALVSYVLPGRGSGRGVESSDGGFPAVGPSVNEEAEFANSVMMLAEIPPASDRRAAAE